MVAITSLWPGCCCCCTTRTASATASLTTAAGTQNGCQRQNDCCGRIILLLLQLLLIGQGVIHVPVHGFHGTHGLTRCKCSFPICCEDSVHSGRLPHAFQSFLSCSSNISSPQIPSECHDGFKGQFLLSQHDLRQKHSVLTVWIDASSYDDLQGRGQITKGVQHYGGRQQREAFPGLTATCSLSSLQEQSAGC